MHSYIAIIIRNVTSQSDFNYDVWAVVSGSYDDFVHHSMSYVLVVFVNGFSLFLLCCGLILYGWLLMNKLALRIPAIEYTSYTTTTTPADSDSQRVRTLRRIISILGICAGCFFLRVLCLIGVITDATRDETLTDQPPLIIWFLVSSWLPTICPVRKSSTHPHTPYSTTLYTRYCLSSFRLPTDWTLSGDTVTQGLVLLYVTRTEREQLHRRIDRTLRRYSSDNTDDSLLANTEEDEGSVGWLFAKNSADTSSQSAGKYATSSAGHHHGAGYVMRSEYWSGDFVLGGPDSSRESVDSSFAEKLIFSNRQSDGWSGDDDEG
jgi:hypothetical protein